MNKRCSLFSIIVSLSGSNTRTKLPGLNLLLSLLKIAPQWRRLVSMAVLEIVVRPPGFNLIWLKRVVVKARWPMKEWQPRPCTAANLRPFKSSRLNSNQTARKLWWFRKILSEKPRCQFQWLYLRWTSKGWYWIRQSSWVIWNHRRWIKRLSSPTHPFFYKRWWNLNKTGI